MTPTLFPFVRPGSQHFVECYAVQAFSIVSNLDPKLTPKEQDQIPMRKVCTFIQSLVSCLSNHHSNLLSTLKNELLR